MADLFRSAANLLRAVAGLFGSAVAEDIASRILSTIIANYRGQTNLEKNLQKLEDLLLGIYKAVDESDGESIRKQLLDRLSKFEDAMREGESVRCNLRRRIDNSSSSSSSPSNNGMCFVARNFFWVNEEVFKIRNTIESLERVAVDINGFIKFLELERLGGLYQSITTTSVSISGKLVGRDREKEAIIKLLLSIDPDVVGNVSILSIMGDGGVGKTALADLVFNDKRVKKNFSLAMWIRASKGSVFDMATLAKSISDYLHCNYSNEDSSSLTRLQEIIKDRLSYHRFLLVLDDVQEINKEEVLDCVRSGKEGSKIVITTRFGNVARGWGTTEGFMFVNRLGYSDCLDTLLLSAFPESTKRTEHPALVDIGNDIVVKLRGHPIGARILGGVLRDNPQKEYWNKVLQNETWNTYQQYGCLPVFYLSYQLLPAHLQRCFAFFGKLPGGWEFTQEILISLWVAEGLVHSNKGKKRKPAEDLASDYFDELLLKSFIQPVHKPGFFTVHDLLHSFAELFNDSSSNSIGSSSSRHTRVILGESA